MAKKPNTTTTEPAVDTAAPATDPTNSTEPTPNSSPVDEAQDNPNAATGDESDNTNTDVQESQPQPAPEDTTTSPTTEAHLTAADPTTPVPAGSADATADATADGQHNGTENTHPQSALHRGELTEQDQADILEKSNQPGAVIGNIANEYGVSPERIMEVIDDQNGVPEDERNV